MKQTIRGIVCSAERIEGKERDHFLPCPPPGRGDGGVFPSPFFFESIQFCGGLFGGRCAINLAQISGHNLAIFPGAEVQRMADKMHDAGLHSGLWKGRCDRLREALQAVHNSDQDVLDL